MDEDFENFDTVHFDEVLPHLELHFNFFHRHNLFGMVKNLHSL